jgi:hypothetical protein
MKTAVRVLVLIASVLALLLGMLCFLFGSLIANLSDALPVEPATPSNEPPRPCPVYLLVPAILSAAGFGSGIAAFVLLRKRAALAGGLAVAAAIFSAFTIIGIIATVLFLTGAIMTLISLQPAQK